MAEHLKARTGAFLIGAVLAALAPTASASADGLNDPTRPPSASAVPEQGAANGALVLQSILVSPGRKVAVISGQAVQPGDKLGDARVASIRESEVVLRNGSEIKVLKLFPAIEKENAASRQTIKNNRQ